MGPIRRSFAILAGALFVLLVGVNLGTPLYAVYGERFGFSSGMVALIFGVYAAVLVPSLLVFGQVSDRVGRRRTIVTGMTVSILGLVLFAVADATAWLLAARAVQGVAVGMVSGSATAALVELEPDGDAGRAALLSTVAQAAGCGAGPLLAGALAQWAPAPLHLCFGVGIVLTLVATVLVRTTPETAGPTGRGRPFTVPGVPAEIRADFVRVGVTGPAVWAVAALFLSVVPSYASDLLHTDDRALFGAIAALMLGTSAAAQVAGQRLSPRRAQAAGLTTLAAGLGALVLAFPAHSLVLVMVAALLTGTGHGLGFHGAQEEVNAIAPPARRGEVTSAFYTCIYAGVAIAIIGSGQLPLALSGKVGVFAAVVGSVALVTAAWHRRRDRGRPPRPGRAVPGGAPARPTG